jgi:hypothetical protein
VLAADTVVWARGKFYGKPSDLDDARRMLRELGGRAHEVVTGVVVGIFGGRIEEFAERTEVVFREIDDNPRAKKRGAKRAGPVSDQMMMALRRMYQGGTFSESDTVCRQGEQQAVETTEAGLALMDTIQEAFWQMADAHSETSGLTAIPRRGYELVAKVSLILAIPSGLRTVEHIRWAYALVRRDIEAKIRMVLSNSDKPSDAIRARVEELLKDGPMTLGRIHNRCQKWPATEVTGVLEAMKNHGIVTCETVPASRGAGRTTTKWSKK